MRREELWKEEVEASPEGKKGRAKRSGGARREWSCRKEHGPIEQARSESKGAERVQIAKAAWISALTAAEAILNQRRN